MKNLIRDRMSGEDLQLVGDVLEAREIRAEMGNMRAAFDTIRVIHMECGKCDDSAVSNCADTVRTFGVMHSRCGEIEVRDLGAGSRT